MNETKNWKEELDKKELKSLLGSGLYEVLIDFIENLLHSHQEELRNIISGNAISVREEVCIPAKTWQQLITLITPHE